MLVANSLGGALVVTEWGRFNEEYVQRIREHGAGRLIIIGGIYAVPKRFEELGIPSTRVGGIDRIETAKLVLERFFKAEARSSVMPGVKNVADYIKDSTHRKAVVSLGNSEVSQRWGRYYASKLGRYMKLSEVRTYTEGDAPRDAELIIAIGNADNNPTVEELWPRTGMPPELTYFPIIYLSRGLDFDVLFISGSDQNIFFTQRGLERLDLLRISQRDALVFAALLLLTLLLLGRAEADNRYFAALSLVLGAFLFQAINRLEKFELIYDSLYVYFDGALSLYFNGAYETILAGRSAPGTSYLTYLYFLLTSPNDVNAHLLTVILSLWILAACYLLATRVLDRNSGIAAAVLLATNPFFYDRMAFFASEIPFATFLLASMGALSADGRIARVGGALALAGAALVRPVGLLLYPAALFGLLRSRMVKDAALLTAYLSFSLLLVQSAVPFFGTIEAYSREALLKAEEVSPWAMMARNATQSALLVFLMATPAMFPGFFIRHGTRFERIAMAYVTLHITALLAWADFFARYLFPLLPLAIILTTTGILGLKHRKLSAALLAIALAMNLYMLFSGYRHPIEA